MRQSLGKPMPERTAPRRLADGRIDAAEPLPYKPADFECRRPPDGWEPFVHFVARPGGGSWRCLRRRF